MRMGIIVSFRTMCSPSSMSHSNFDGILIPDTEHTILQGISKVQTFQDELEILFDTIPSQVIHGLLFALIETINNAFYFYLINYERNGGDPMKRSVKNHKHLQEINATL